MAERATTKSQGTSDRKAEASPRRLRAFVRRPTVAQLTDIASKEFYHLSPDEGIAYAEAVGRVLSLIDELDDYPTEAVTLRHQLRDPGAAPSREVDPLNVFIRTCRVAGTGGGSLAGVRVGVKDNIAVAGIPITNGSRTIPYVPIDDATVVERVLDAGAIIIGKLNMDDFGSAGTGETSFHGPVLNPVDPSRSAGGSSSGAGAAVASAAVDLAIGVDQGGSARIPAAYCGAVSLKPTHGLVSSYGVTHIDHTFDAVSPVAMSIELVAKALDAISGEDPRDPQWVRGAIEASRSVDSLDAGVAGMTVGFVEEGVNGADCEASVIAGLERAKDLWARAGATIRPISVPLWRSGWAIEVALLCQLGWAMSQSEGQGWSHLGRVDVERSRAFALSRRLEGDRFPPFYKVWMLVGRYLHEEYFAEYLGKAMNLRAALRAQVDDAFRECDLLVTPTTPGPAPELAVSPVTEMDLLARGTPMSGNTCPLNLTGHPALAVPSGEDESGLPVSVQIIAPRFQDARTIRAGRVLHE
ncbi:MAG: amidase family protein [Candidatus Dormibacteraceae bacterium]